MRRPGALINISVAMRFTSTIGNFRVRPGGGRASTPPIRFPIFILSTPSPSSCSSTLPLLLASAPPLLLHSLPHPVTHPSLPLFNPSSIPSPLSPSRPLAH
eukprot:8487453-Pyramimonas_sp.AAC.1